MLLASVVGYGLSESGPAVGRGHGMHETPSTGIMEERGSPGMSGGEGRIPCFRGSVWLGDAEGSVDIDARCKPLVAGEEMEIGVALAPLKGGTRVPIKAYRQRPIISGVKGFHRRGVCARDRRSDSSIHCTLKSKSAIVIQGRVWLQGDACDAEVVLTSAPKLPPCDGACPLSYPVAVLANGRPQGC